jgi:hypothetical protein
VSHPVQAVHFRTLAAALHAVVAGTERNGEPQCLRPDRNSVPSGLIRPDGAGGARDGVWCRFAAEPVRPE